MMKEHSLWGCGFLWWLGGWWLGGWWLRNMDAAGREAPQIQVWTWLCTNKSPGMGWTACHLAPCHLTPLLPHEFGRLLVSRALITCTGSHQPTGLRVLAAQPKPPQAPVGGGADRAQGFGAVCQS